MVDTDDTRRTMDDGRRTTPGVWHKLPTGELKTLSKLDLEPKCQGHSRNQKIMTWGTKNMPPKNKAYRPNAHLLYIVMPYNGSII